MLHNLRSSPLDVQRLVGHFENLVGKTHERWETDVIDQWFNDGTMENHSRHCTYAESLSIIEGDESRIIEGSKSV
jgi:hypothetical protein